jgi:hypothetical protein
MSDELQRVWKELCPVRSAILAFARRDRGNTRKPVAIPGLVEETGIETLLVTSLGL